MHEPDARLALVDAARRLDAAGLNHNSSGNLSVKLDADVLVTPTGIPATVLEPGDCVLLHPDGTRTHPGRMPTSEWRLHTELHARRGDVEAIVHTHSREATAAAALGRPIPAVHYVVARFGASVLPCARYATYGSQQLADNVVATLGERGMACLMANHGALTLGRDLASAVALALDVEWLCGVNRRAVQLGEPAVLDDAELARVAELFRTYGQPGG